MTQVLDPADMPVRLGAQPNRKLNVTLVPGASFWSILENTIGPWEVGITIELRFDDDTVWTASILGDQATFSELPAAVDDLIDNLPEGVGLYYTDASGHVIPWALGAVVVDEH